MPAGETEKAPSGWTIDTLHEHLTHLLGEMNRRYEQRFESQQEAIRRAEQATEKRFESVNEFRSQLGDQAREFIPRNEAIQRADANAEKIAALDKRLTEALSAINSRLDLSAGRSSGLDKGWALLAGAIAVVGGVVGTVVALAQ